MTEDTQNTDNDDVGTEETTTEVSSLELSDEEFLKAPEPEEPVDTTEPSEETVEKGTTDEGTVIEEPTDSDITKDTDSGSTTAEDDTDNADSDAEVDTEKDTTDFSAIGKEVMGEFKANGRKMKAKSAADIINLMQMGANYHKKMTGLKPSLKMVKLLEKHDLLDPEKVSYLIDLHEKKPEAITQLLKDSEIDPLDIDVKAESTYKPQPRMVSDTEMDLDSVLESIQETPTYQKTLNVLTTEWDEASRNAIAAKPQIISAINGHMENGIYDKVADAVAYERSLGRLNGLSDVEAYNQVGNVLHQQGKLGPQQPATNQPEPEQTTQPVTNKNTKAEADRLKRKKAAAPTKTSQKTAKKKFDPLSMSDEEFLKFEQTQISGL